MVRVVSREWVPGRRRAVSWVEGFEVCNRYCEKRLKEVEDLDMLIGTTDGY